MKELMGLRVYNFPPRSLVPFPRTKDSWCSAGIGTIVSGENAQGEILVEWDRHPGRRWRVPAEHLLVLGKGMARIGANPMDM